MGAHECALRAGVRGGGARGDRTVLARAITLVESGNEDHRRLAQQVLTGVLGEAGGSHRVGITGVPGSASPPSSTNSV
ncbi:MAG: hypothetical protein M5U19_00310 [Microthrixaceae bacterium]|nr:hypothetical protein [Microthrixaceae bacterium]